MKSQYFIKSVVKALAAMEYLSRSAQPRSLTDVAKAVGIPTGSASRYIRTLYDMGYVDQETSTRRYHLSTKAFKLGAHLLSSMDLRSRILPSMVEMTEKWNVTSQCAILDGTDIVYIERIKALNVVNLDLAVGSHLPVDCTAMGRAILAHMDSDEAAQLVEKIDFMSHTPYTITDRKEFMAELSRTKARGYAINTEELALGLETLAAPILNGKGVEAAFGVSYPVHQFDSVQERDQLAAELLEVASQISVKKLQI